jgi:kynureninase
MEFTEGPFRWLNGTPNIPGLYIASEGPRIIQKAGIDKIREKSLRQTGRLMELAESRGYRVHAPKDPARRGGTVAFDVPHGYEVAQYLLSRQILVDYRVGAGIRVAPHFYTKDDELESCVAAIDDCLENGAWKRFTTRESVVT